MGLDSGGYTEIELFGGWRTPARDYIALVRFLRDEVGNLALSLLMVLKRLTVLLTEQLEAE